MRTVLRKILEATHGPMTDSEFAEVMDLIRTDVKVNRVAFNRRTSTKEAVDIALGCFMALQRGVAV